MVLVVAGGGEIDVQAPLLPCLANVSSLALALALATATLPIIQPSVVLVPDQTSLYVISSSTITITLRLKNHKILAPTNQRGI
jgi:hypothetical protein